MMTRTIRQGGLLASLLSGAWRSNCQPVILSMADLERLLPVVVQSGTAGLVWRRLRRSGLAESRAGLAIHEARVAMAAVTAIRAAELDRLLQLTSPGPELILLKGWAHARLYPEPGLRPYGDFDLVTVPQKGARPSITLPEWDGLPVDIHHSLVDLPDRTWDEIRARSLPGPSGSSQLRVLGPEDDLRLSCLHLLRHAVEMPPRTNPWWLCDLAVMLETLPPEFDWEYCLAGQRSRSQWMLAVIRLTNQLLGARLDRCPPGVVPVSIPGWMTQIFLRLWGRGERTFFSLPYPLPFEHVRRDIRTLPRALAERWPSPLQSVCRLSWPITHLSGRLAQVVDYGSRAVSWGPRHARRPGRAAAGG